MINKCYCGNSLENSKLIYNIKKYQVRRCNNCTQLFTFPVPYENPVGYEEYTGAETVHTDARLREEYKNYARVDFLIFDKKTLCNKKYLNIGCGGGESLEIAKENGMEVFGVEINPHQRNYLKDKGFNVYKDIDGLPDIQFDFIVLSSILEHILTPIEFLKKIKCFLKLGTGKLLIAVPNFDSLLRKILKSFWVGYQPAQHIWHFEPDTLTNLLKLAGIEIIKLEKHCLGKGLDKNDSVVYSDANFLIDPQNSRIMYLFDKLIVFLDFNGKLGWLIRKISDTDGDQIFVLCKSGNE